MNRRTRLGLALATPFMLAATMIGGASAASAATSDVPDDCDFVPLRFTRNYSSEDADWKAKANLKVYDMCDEDGGAITGKLYIGVRNDTDFDDISPYRPKLSYKLHRNQNSYTSENVSLTRQSISGSWRPWRVDTDEFDFNQNNWFSFIRIRYTVTVDDDTFTKTVVCERVEEDGDDAYDC